MNAPYLRVTIHDNDFTSYAYELGDAIRDILRFACDNFTTSTVEQIDLEAIKPYIASIWYGIDALSHHFWWKGTSRNENQTNTCRNWFEDGLDLEIVDYTDILDWDNCESIYIALYANDDKDTEIIIR